MAQTRWRRLDSAPAAARRRRHRFHGWRPAGRQGQQDENESGVTTPLRSRSRTSRSTIVYRSSSRLAAVHGLSMTEQQLAMFQAHTGRTVPRPGGYNEAVAIVGRQSGTTMVAAIVAVFEAIRTERATGVDLFALLGAQDARAALRTSFRYAAAPLEASPILRRSVVNRTADTIVLRRVSR
jgi:hypothetical protein